MSLLLLMHRFYNTVLLICVHSYIDFDILVSYKEQFCNGSEMANGNLTDGIYFQYRTNINRTWITVDYYNG